MGNFDERDKRPPQPVVIEDRRHLRDVEETEPEVEAESAAALPAESPEPDAGPPAVAAASASTTAQPTAAAAPEQEYVEDEAALSEEELAAAQQAEMAYMMRIFQLGLPNYLRSQLGILLNFALINLGRAANPATGLVATDMDQAKLAIDSFEFILSRVQAQLEPRERMELVQLLSELKYTFMQALGGPAKAAPPAGNGD